ncbi:hypothetical protein AA206_13210 [Salmonella enterica subsp. enterica serovar Newport]|nr:hypothetical protein [Salmonella enterica subsp. enterica serovar Newport]
MNNLCPVNFTVHNKLHPERGRAADIIGFSRDGGTEIFISKTSASDFIPGPCDHRLAAFLHNDIHSQPGIVQQINQRLDIPETNNQWPECAGYS